jgi:FkbM family methyltransferase
MISIRKIIARFYDPIVDVQVGNVKIKSPLSHPLYHVLRGIKQFGWNTTRIASTIGEKYKDFTIIDIGANIGDTVAFIRNEVPAEVLCIEGDDFYFKILEQNSKTLKGVSLHKGIVGSSSQSGNLQIKRERGTGWVETSATPVKQMSLDDILQLNPTFANAKLFKIDTDGYDSLIIKGAANYLQRAKPVIFLEYDPFLLEKNDKQYNAIFDLFKTNGYKYALFYMSYGDFIAGIDITDDRLLQHMLHYFEGRRGDFYCDLCVIHESDKDIFTSLCDKEIAHFKKFRNYN